MFRTAVKTASVATIAITPPTDIRRAGSPALARATQSTHAHASNGSAATNGRLSWTATRKSPWTSASAQRSPPHNGHHQPVTARKGHSGTWRCDGSNATSPASASAAPAAADHGTRRGRLSARRLTGCRCAVVSVMAYVSSSAAGEDRDPDNDADHGDDDARDRQPRLLRPHQVRRRLAGVCTQHRRRASDGDGPRDPERGASSWWPPSAGPACSPSPRRC
jgi:hypothetical protein